MRIHRLKKEVIDRIAAGEVVERPASVLKELVENSLDAGADDIEIDVENGGKTSIRVTDNGGGMDRESLLLSVERHTTSKIDSERDLETIASMGFRGEALSSIFSVSRMEFITCMEGCQHGWRLYGEGGVVLGIEEHGCPRGCSVEVKDLFYNTPPRAAFLKSPRTEFARITNMVQRLALGNPKVGIRLRHNERIIINTHPHSSEDVRVRDILGENLYERLVKFSLEEDPVRVHGFTSSPQHFLNSSRNIHLFMNRRPVRDRSLFRAVLNAYVNKIPHGMFPAVVLYIIIDPLLVDVNVHPQKSEVRFREPDRVCRLVTRSLEETLEDDKAILLGVSETKGEYHPHRIPAIDLREKDIDLWEGEDSTAFRYRPLKTASTDYIKEIPFVSGTADTLPLEDFIYDGVGVNGGPVSILAQFHQSYILIQSKDGLVIVDQHAAHERLLFNRLKEDFLRGGTEIQRLLSPETLEMAPDEANALCDNLESLKKAGFEVEPFGRNTILLKGVPAACKIDNPLRLLSDIAGDLKNDSSPSSSSMDGLLKRLACSGAIKAGQRLSMEEMKELFRMLCDTDYGSTCPHGRPVAFKLSLKEIEKSLRRV